MIEVILHSNDLASIDLIAKRRNQKPTHTSRQFYNQRKGVDTHILGLLGEMALAKFTHWPVDTETKPGGDGGIDFCANGRTYSLKTRERTQKRPCPDLIVRLEYATADRFILAWVDMRIPQDVTLVGWCTHDELWAGERVDLGYGPRLMVRYQDLREIPKETNHGR